MSSSCFHSPEIHVVEASAGSGKTYALARRYVRLILHLSRGEGSIPVHSILAITFTNKAALEMKERILRFLKELALGVMPVESRDDMLQGLGLSPEEARKIALRVMEGILRQYHYFQVETIDRFMRGLLMSSAFQIGLTADFRIETSSREYLSRALDELIDDAAKDRAVKQAFDDFLSSMLFVEARSAWMPRDIVLDTVEQLFHEYNTSARLFCPPHMMPQDMIRLKAGLIADVKDFVVRMPEGAHKTFVGSMKKFVEANSRAFRFAQGLSAYFEPGKDLPKTKGCVFTTGHIDRWLKIQEDFAAAADLEVRHLYDPYIRLFNDVRRKVERAALADDVVFLEELNAKARLVYEEGATPEELYYRLSTRFEHYLIDEFQDTSILQWENLKALPEDAIARGGSLFYVGDKKQAIFSFRGGDTRLFDAIRRQFDGPGYNLGLERLMISRRSHKSIVEFNNAVFDLENLKRLMGALDKNGKRIVPSRSKDADELERVYAGAAQVVVKQDPVGCVRAVVLNGANKEAFREDAKLRVMALLEELKGRFSFKDVGIILRKNEEVEAVTRWLIEKGIPVASERTLNVKEEQSVGEVVSFLKFLVSPVDNASFAQFILGDIFIKASQLTQERVQDFILAWREDKNRGYLYIHFRDAFPKEWEGLVEVFFRNVGLVPLYELVSSFYRVTRALVLSAQSRGFLMHFLNLVKVKEDEFPGLEEFLAHYEALEGDELYIKTAGIDAVTVTTVHKAKGLEHRVVILPFLAMSMSRSLSPKRRALAYALRQTGEGLALYHFNETHTKYSRLAEELDVDEDMKMFFSELNNVYVALTRAACEMYLFLPPKAGLGRNLAIDLIPDTCYALGFPSGSYPLKKDDEAGEPVDLAPSACRDWLSFLHEEFMDNGEIAARPVRLKGLLVHALLEKIGIVLDGDMAAAVKKAVALLEAEGLWALQEDSVSVVEDFLGREAVRPFFVTAAKEVFCEKECVSRSGHAKRMDRVLVFDKEVWVIDFKLGAIADDAGQQVGEYMAMLKDIYPGYVIKGFLVSVESGDVVHV
ncbi:MAG: UvrD-helicase domain-containing protein [Candidatus Omnitrophica bacterium]|nr:UvrD-helicase domain-containing protein [Candidatus Omnitrophota bacterium]